MNQTPPPYNGPDRHQQYNYSQEQPYNMPNPQPFDYNTYYGRNNAFDSDALGKSRGVAGLLAILIGGLGIHYFYLDKTPAGLITILLTAVSCGFWSIITLIQGVLFFAMSNEDFDRKFVYNTSTFPIF